MRIDQRNNIFHAPEIVRQPAAIAGDMRSVLCIRTKL
jgi:hypothetical protein